MNENTFDELEHLSRLQVALESFDSLPKDASEILNAFKCSSPSFENMTFGDKQVSLESIGSKVKELAIQIAKWIKAQISAFIAFLKSGKLEIDVVEKEVEKIEEELSSARAFHEDEIVLSPLVTGHLAINGVLDSSFANNMSRVRDTLQLIFEMQPAACQLAEKISKGIAATAGNGEGNDTRTMITDLSEFSQRYGRKLVTADKSRTFKKSYAVVQGLESLGKVKIQDMASLPLPGGYALVGTLTDIPSTIDLGEEFAKHLRAKNILEGLINSIKPELVKTESSGITFKGDALTRNDCNTVVTESKAILSTLKQSFADDNAVTKALKEVDNSATRVGKVSDNDMKGYAMSEDLKILRALVKFIEMDKSQLTRYSLKVIRAAVRYVHASIVPEKSIEPVSEGNRPAAPSAA